MERCYYVELDAKRISYRYTAKDDFASVEVLFDSPAGAKSFEVSEKAARLDVLMRIPGMRGYFEQCGYATKWEASTRIMAPIVAESIYKGRLGEVCGRFVLEQSGIAVADIDDAFRFEKFDFVLPGTLGDQEVFIDFKHWKSTRTERDGTRKSSSIGCSRRWRRSMPRRPSSLTYCRLTRAIIGRLTAQKTGEGFLWCRRSSKATARSMKRRFKL